MANSSRIFFSASTAESFLASDDASKPLRWLSWVHSMTLHFHSCCVSSGWHVPPLQGLLLLNIPNPITNEPFALPFLSSSGVTQCLRVKYAFFFVFACLFYLFVFVLFFVVFFFLFCFVLFFCFFLRERPFSPPFRLSSKLTLVTI